jgi:hypothetical protein
MKEIILVTKPNALTAHRISPCRKGDLINHSLESYLKFLQLLLINIDIVNEIGKRYGMKMNVEETNAIRI